MKILGCCYRDNAGIFILVSPQQETGLFRIRSWVGSWNLDLGLSLFPICFDALNACVVAYFEPIGNAPDESFPFVPKVHKCLGGPWACQMTTVTQFYLICFES